MPDYSDQPNNVHISVQDDGKTLTVELIDFSAGVPGAVKVVLPRNAPLEALNALVNELYANTDVYAGLITEHLEQVHPRATDG